MKWIHRMSWEQARSREGANGTVICPLLIYREFYRNAEEHPLSVFRVMEKYVVYISKFVDWLKLEIVIDRSYL
jgi:hypothetical protein